MKMINFILTKTLPVLFTAMIAFSSLSKVSFAEPKFTVDTSTIGQVKFSGTGIDGTSFVTIFIIQNSNGQIRSSGDVTVTNQSFSYIFLVDSNGSFNYSINDESGVTLKSGALDLPAGVNTGGSSGGNTGNSSGSNTSNPSGGNTGNNSSGTNTGNSSGTNTGNSSGTNTGNSSGTNTGNSSGTNTGNSSGTNTSNTPTSSGEFLIQNPLKNIDSLPKLIEAILNIILKIGVWVLAGFIIYDGYLFVAARGATDKLKEAKQALLWTAIGGMILLGAWVIANAIVGTIEALK